MAKLKCAVLISGRGSNMQSLIDACSTADFPAEIVCVVSNRPKAPGLQRASKASIPTAIVDHKTFAEAAEFEAELDQTLRNHGVEFICLAGFMRLLSSEFVSRWSNRIVNIHPSLLPAFKGLHIHTRVLESGVRISGCTVHYVRPEMDEGPIIIQAAVPVLPDDTPEQLAERVLKMEHRIYPTALRLIAEGKVRVSGSQVIYDGMPMSDGMISNPLTE